MKKFVFGVFLILFFISSSYLVYSDTVPDTIDGDTLSCGDIITNRNVRIIGGELNCGYGQDGLKLEAQDLTPYIHIYFEDTTINGDYGGSAGITIVSDGSYYIYTPNINNFSVGIKVDSGVELVELYILNSSYFGSTGGFNSYIHGCDDGINITDASFLDYSEIIINGTDFGKIYYPEYAKNAINININNNLNKIQIENNSFRDFPEKAINIVGGDDNIDYFDINNNYFGNISQALYLSNVNVLNGLEVKNNIVSNTGAQSGNLFHFTSVDNPGSAFWFQNNILDSNNPIQLYFVGSAERGVSIQSNQFNTNGLPIAITSSVCNEESYITGNSANSNPIYFYVGRAYSVLNEDWSNSQQVEFCGSIGDFSNIVGNNIQNLRIRNSNNLYFDNVNINIPNQISIQNSNNIRFNNSIVNKTSGTSETFYIYNTNNFGFYNGDILNSGDDKISYNNLIASESYLYNVSDIENRIDFMNLFDEFDQTQVYIGNNLNINIAGLDNQPIENANVVVKNETGNIVFNGTTDYYGNTSKTLFSYIKTRSGNGPYQNYSINTTKEDYHLNTTTSIILPNENNIVNISLNQIPLFGKIKIQPGADEGYDTFVSTYSGAQQEGAGGNSDYDFIRMGYKNNYIYRSLLNFNLSDYPVLNSGLIEITKAELILTLKNTLSQDINSSIYKINSNWPQSITDFSSTDNLISGESEADSVVIASGTEQGTQIVYNITTILNDWVENNEENYGFLIKADDAASYVDFYSADASTFTRENLPKLIITYRVKNIINYEDKNLTLNLSMFFEDDDNLIYDYSVSVGNYTPTFTSPVLTLEPDTAFIGSGNSLFFNASDSLSTATSNLVGINTLEVIYPEINKSNVHERMVPENTTEYNSSISITLPKVNGAKECMIYYDDLAGFRSNNWNYLATTNCGEGETTFVDSNAGNDVVRFYKVYSKTYKNREKQNPFIFGKISYDLSTNLDSQNNLFGFPFYNANVSNSPNLFNFLSKYFDIKQIIDVEGNWYNPSYNHYDNFPINSNLGYKLIFDSASQRHLTYAGIYNQTNNRTLSGLTTWITLPLNTSITKPEDIFNKFNNNTSYKVKSISSYNVGGEIQRGTVYTPLSYVSDSIIGKTFDLVPGIGIDIELDSSESLYSLDFS